MGRAAISALIADTKAVVFMTADNTYSYAHFCLHICLKPSAFHNDRAIMSSCYYHYLSVLPLSVDTCEALATLAPTLIWGVGFFIHILSRT